MALRAFLTILGSDAKGETNDSKHAAEGAIEVTSWSHEIIQPRSATASTTGGHTAERTEHAPMAFTKEIDASSPKLYQAASAGTVYPAAKVVFYRAVGGSNATQQENNDTPYLQIELTNVVVSRIATRLGDAGHKEGNLPVETLELSYDEVKWRYNSSAKDGSNQQFKNITGGWSLSKNKVVA